MTSNDPPLEVLVYGLGAVGSFYAFILSRSEQVRLTVIARSNYDAVKANGIQIKSQNHGEHCVHPARVVRSAAEAGHTFDYVVCAHKAIDQSSVPPQIRPAVDEERSTIVIIQNGVGNEEPFRSAFPATTIVSCVTWTGVRQPQPGVITHRRSENLQLGLYRADDADADPADPADPADDPPEARRRLARLAALLAAGRTPAEVVPDVRVQRWEKAAWNAAWNPLTALTRGDTHAWLASSAGAAPLARRLAREVADVARGLGVPVAPPAALADALVARARSRPPVGSSMRADREAGRPMEVEAILGHPVRRARELGVDVPALETLFVVLTAINKQIVDGNAGV